MRNLQLGVGGIQFFIGALQFAQRPANQHHTDALTAVVEPGRAIHRQRHLAVFALNFYFEITDRLGLETGAERLELFAVVLLNKRQQRAANQSLLAFTH